MEGHDDTAAVADALFESAQANVLPTGAAADLLDGPAARGAEPGGHAANPAEGPVDDELEEAIEEAG